MKPFDYVNSINHGKKNLMEGTDNDELAESDYVPFLTNRSLSYFSDTVFYSNEINQYPHADKKLQYDYLLNSVRKKKRYSKWLKPEKLQDLDVVKEYYGYNDDKALQALRILTKDQLDKISYLLRKGGNNGKRS